VLVLVVCKKESKAESLMDHHCVVGIIVFDDVQLVVGLEEPLFVQFDEDPFVQFDEVFQYVLHPSVEEAHHQLFIIPQLLFLFAKLFGIW
jgi:hypothetical protein